MTMKRYWISSMFLCFLAAALTFGSEAIYDVRDYGAKADGKTL